MGKPNMRSTKFERAPQWSVEGLKQVVALKLASQGASVRRAFRDASTIEEATDAREVTITKQQFYTLLLRSLNLSVGPRVAGELFDVIDADATGKIDYLEFSKTFGDAIFGAAYEGKDVYTGVDDHVQRLAKAEVSRTRATENPISADQCRAELRQRLASQHSAVNKAFRSMDKDHSGYIDREEFMVMLRGFNIYVTEKTADDLIRGVDENGSGKISYKEFNDYFGSDIAGHGCGGQKQHNGPSKMSQVVQDLIATKKNVTHWTENDFLLAMEGILMTRARTVRRIFRGCDRDLSGEIDRDEWREALKRLNLDLTKKDADCFFDLVDSDGSGHIDYREFVKGFGEAIAGFRDSGVLVLNGKQQCEDRLTRQTARRAATAPKIPRYSPAQIRDVLTARFGGKFSSAATAFRRIDTDHSGYLTHAEFRYFLASLNIELHDKDFSTFVSEIDGDGDGFVDYREFLKTFGDAICGAPWQNHPAQTTVNNLRRTSRRPEQLPPPAYHHSEALRVMHVKFAEMSASTRKVFHRFNTCRKAQTLDASSVEYMCKACGIPHDFVTVKGLIDHLNEKHNGPGGVISYDTFTREFGHAISGAGDASQHFEIGGATRVQRPEAARKHVDAETARAMLGHKLANNFRLTRQAFRKFNSEMGPTLDPSEVRAALASYHIHMHDAEFEKFVDAFDGDGDGELKFDEFRKVFGGDISGYADDGVSSVLRRKDEARAAKMPVDIEFYDAGDPKPTVEEEDDFEQQQKKRCLAETAVRSKLRQAIDLSNDPRSRQAELRKRHAHRQKEAALRLSKSSSSLLPAASTRWESTSFRRPSTATNSRTLEKKIWTPARSTTSAWSQVPPDTDANCGLRIATHKANSAVLRPASRQ